MLHSRFFFGGLLLAIFLTSTAVAKESIPVRDFCALKPKPVSDSYQKQRVVVFGVGNLKLVEAGEDRMNEKGEKIGRVKILKTVRAAQHFSDVFTSQFAMRRFYNLMAATPGKRGWSTAEQIPVSSVVQHIRRTAPSADKFLGYSVSCADFIAVPNLTSYEPKWRVRKVQRVIKGKKVTRLEETLSISSSMEISVFKREGDAFVLVERVEEEGGGMFDTVADLGSSTMSASEAGNQMLGDKLKGGKEKIFGYANELKANVALLEKKRAEVEIAIKEKQMMLADLKNDFKSAMGEDASSALDGPIEGVSNLGSEALELKEVYDEIMGEAMSLMIQVNQLEAQMDAALEFISDPVAGATKMAEESAYTWDALATGIPTSNCVRSKPVDGKPGLKENCSGTTAWLPERLAGITGIAERNGKFCKNVKKGNARKHALCEVRVRSETLTLLVQKASKSIEGWRIIAPLQLGVEDDPTMVLGEKEGIQSGNIFWAKTLDRNGEEDYTGFGRVVSVGPGGEFGAMDPTTLRWRVGSGRAGSTLQEHAQAGVAFGVMPGISTMLVVSDSPLVKDLQSMVGLSLDTGFDQTKHTEMGWGEFWVRTHLNTHYAQLDSQSGVLNVNGADNDGDQVQWILIHTHAGPELKIYLFPAVDLVAGIAGGGTFVMGISDREIKKKSSADAFEEGEDATDLALGYTLGAIGDVGLDFVFHPDWSLRLGIQYRYNFMDVELMSPNHEDGSKNRSSTFYGTKEYQNLGTLSGVNAIGGLTYIF